MTAVILPLLLGIRHPTLLVSRCNRHLAVCPLYMISPMTSSVFDLMGVSEESVSNRVEYTVLRERRSLWAELSASAFFLSWRSQAPTPSELACLLLILGAAPIAGWWFIRRQLRAAA